MRHEIRGRVIDQFTGDGIGGVRVEAWDKDFGLDDFLGFASTRSDGSFSVTFDESAFRDLFFDNFPMCTSRSFALTNSWRQPRIRFCGMCRSQMLALQSRLLILSRQHAMSATFI
jgi:hypothetical protein